MKAPRPGLNDNYSKTANVLIQGYPELSLQDRYVAIGLISLYWDEKAYPVSLRELAAKIHVDHTSLRSRGGVRPSEGILDRLWRFGLIGLMEGKPITETGNKGRVQTYLTVNHSEIAAQNAKFALEKKGKSPRSTVVNDNSKRTPEKETVVPDNHTVVISNDTVVNDNHTVVHVSTKVPPNTSNTSKDIEDSFSAPEDLQQRIAELEQQLAESQRLQENKAHQSIVSQEIVPPEKTPPTFAGPLSMKPDQPTFRLPTANEIEKQYRQREREVWALLDTLFGVQVTRGGYNKAPVERMARNEDFTDEHITIAFKAIDQDKYTKLTVANIENEMPTRVREFRKVIQFPTNGSQNKPKSVDEQIAESEQAAKQFEADQQAKREARLAREAQERIQVAR